MSSEKDIALVLRVIDFSETSCVVTLLSREHGKFGALAKGARRLKSSFDSALDLLALCRIVFLRKPSAQLDLLTEARLERRFRPPGSEMPPLYAGYYVGELLSSLTDEYDPHPELFDLAVATLAALQSKGPVGQAVLQFEFRSLRLLGHLPNLHECVLCGKPPEKSQRVAFGLTAGGVLCGGCRAGQRRIISVSAAALGTMRIYTDANLGDEPAAIPQNLRGEVRGVVNQYIAHLLGRKPRMQEYLGFLTTEDDRPS